MAVLPAVNHAKAGEATVTKLIGLVRDGKTGLPKFDDFHDIPKGVHHLLSEEDWQYIKEQQELQDGNFS